MYKCVNGVKDWKWQTFTLECELNDKVVFKIYKNLIQRNTHTLMKAHINI